MTKNIATSKILDEVLKLIITSSALGVALVAPNILIALDKPLQQYYSSLNKRDREREARRLIYYMKSQGYLKGEYEHGLQITDKAKRRYKKNGFKYISVGNPDIWDHKWRMVIYDIPEQFKLGRMALASKLRDLGFFQLQKSAWIHPFPCRDVIEQICSTYGTSNYVSYFEIISLDNETSLIKRYKKRYPSVTF